MLRYYMKRILTNPIFYICLAIGLFALITPCRHELPFCRVDRLPIMYMLSTTEMGIFSMLVPILTTAPFMLVFTEELKEKVVFYQMIRAGRKHFYRDQILSAIFCGVIIGAITWTVWLIVMLGAGARFPATNDWFGNFIGTNLESMVETDAFIWLSIWYLLVQVFYCLHWNLMGMALSLVTKNKYVLIAAPFIIYLVWEYMTQMIYSMAKGVMFVNPGSMRMSGGLEYLPYWQLSYSYLYPIVVYVILIGGLGGLYYIVTKRRFLREGL